jgi:hypothetical protein
MQPAHIKTKVYFMWDFIGRTLGMALIVPPTITSETMGSLPARDREAWSDLQSGCVMAAELILDTRPGMLDMMVEGTHRVRTGEMPFGQRPNFWDEIKEAARVLKAAGRDEDVMVRILERPSCKHGLLSRSR